MLGNSKCQTLANDLRRLRFHKDITVAGVAQVWVPVLDEAAKAQPHSAQHAQPAICPECGGDGADHEDSSRDCFECHGAGVVPGKQQAVG